MHALPAYLLLMIAMLASLARTNPLPALPDPSPSPTHAAEIAPRSFQSGGVTCYYQCPDSLTVGGGLYLSLGVLSLGLNTRTSTCQYGLLLGLNCVYDNASGVLQPGLLGLLDGRCPKKLTNIVCGSTQPPNSFKKRGNVDDLKKKRRRPEIDRNQWVHPSRRADKADEVVKADSGRVRKRREQKRWQPSIHGTH